MDILSKHCSFVNDQIRFQEKMARKYAGESWRMELHSGNARRFSELLTDLEIAKREIDRKSDESSKFAPTYRNMILTPDDLDGLPEDVLQELSISESDRQEFSIIGIINEAGGILSLDKIIVGLFRKTNEKVKRNALTSRLYRMAQKRLIFNVPTKKGFYATRQVGEQDVIRIFGAEESEEGDRDSL